MESPMRSAASRMAESRSTVEVLVIVRSGICWSRSRFRSRFSWLAASLFVVQSAAAVQERPRLGPLVIARLVPGAPQNVLVCGQAFKSHGAAGVQAAGADTDLGAESVAVAVGKSRGGVMVDA